MSSRILVIFFLAVVTLCSACKTVIVKPNDLNFAGISIYPDGTYDYKLFQHDVAGVILNFGQYTYEGDTLILKTDTQEYLSTLTKPKQHACLKKEVYIHFKDFEHANNENQSLPFYYLESELKGISLEGDTSLLWKPVSINRKTNPKQIHFVHDEFEGIRKVWLEINKVPTTTPIVLPENDNCLEITIPIINTIASQVLDQSIMQGMRRFVFKEKGKKNILVEMIDRNRRFKLSKSDKD